MVGCTACFSVECRGSASQDINSPNITEDTIVYRYTKYQWKKVGVAADVFQKIP